MKSRLQDATNMLNEVKWSMTFKGIYLLIEYSRASYSTTAADWDVRYFDQRYDIFSRYDDGIWMTEDAWFGVTPEPVAR